jgi:hypothetical protein
MIEADTKSGACESLFSDLFVLAAVDWLDTTEVPSFCSSSARFSFISGHC